MGDPGALPSPSPLHARIPSPRVADCSADRRGESLYSLAGKSGVHSGTISRIEQGHLSPTVATLEKLAKALESPSVTYSLRSASRRGRGGDEAGGVRQARGF